MGVEPKNRGVYPPKWMVKIMEKTLSKWTIWGVFPLFSETSKYIHLAFRVPHLLKGVPCLSPWIAVDRRWIRGEETGRKIDEKTKGIVEEQYSPLGPMKNYPSQLFQLVFFSLKALLGRHIPTVPLLLLGQVGCVRPPNCLCSKLLVEAQLSGCWGWLSCLLRSS